VHRDTRASTYIGLAA